MSDTAKKTDWVIEFDTAADPETDSRAVEDSLRDFLAHSKGRTIRTGNRIELSDRGDAFLLKMHFSENIVGISQKA
jgi:hypothetical protein